ncbi:transcriptional regulator TbsP domain-containing protein [Haloparvum sp. PAK95]|uniref:transcriptional regulator TbsP domain-containing protein n=1 Tax=Haloparvum sp. PAK95 TaxID=3418962 RepID=UPI003D2F44C9
MSAAPSLATVDGRLSFADAGRVLAVDPDPALLDSLLDTWAAAVPGALERGERPPEAADAPDAPEAASAGAGGERDRATDVNCPDEDSTGDDVPQLAVLARKRVLDAVFDDFHARCRGSGLQEADRLSLSVLEAPQPNALVVVDDQPVAVVDAGRGWIPVGNVSGSERSTTRDDREGGELYRDHVAGAEAYRLRTPSRGALYRAFAERCSPAVARDLLALLDASATVRRHDPCDQLVRAYLVGARHGVVNYDLRRASEDCGLASPSTLSTVKAELEADGLLETASVPQPRGRPRQRLEVGVDELDTAPLATIPELVRELRTESDE